MGTTFIPVAERNYFFAISKKPMTEQPVAKKIDAFAARMATFAGFNFARCCLTMAPASPIREVTGWSVLYILGNRNAREQRVGIHDFGPQRTSASLPVWPPARRREQGYAA